MLAIALIGLIAVFILAYITAGTLSAASNARVGPPPAHIPVKPVSFESESGSQIKGWFVQAEQSRGAVLLLHGVRANRTQMLGRAKFLLEAGYSSLLIDFQAHGESAGEYITFGYLESRDVRAATDYLGTLEPEKPIGIIGVSLGGAAFVLAERSQDVNAVVLEAVYTDFHTAVENRLERRLGILGRYLSPILTLQVRPRLGFDPSFLSPISKIQNIGAPVLLIAGGQDRHTTLEQSHELFRSMKEPKKLWVVKGAGHVDFHAHGPDEYSERILSFFSKYLRLHDKLEVTVLMAPSHSKIENPKP